MATPATNKAWRFPRTQTLRFVVANNSLPAGYNTWPFDQAFFWQHIRPFFQTPTNYNYKMLPTDKISIYFDTLAPNVNVYLYNDQGKLVHTFGTALPGTEYPVNPDSYFNQPFYTYYFNYQLSTLSIPDGFYSIVIQTNYAGDTSPGVDVYFASEVFQLRASGFEKTLLFEFTNLETDYDMFFGPFTTHTGVIPSLITSPLAVRVEADIDIDPAFHDVSFEDMFYTNEKLQSVPYNTGALTVGGEGGVPSYMLDKINRILSMDIFIIDGVQWYKDTNAAWSIKKATDYAMKAGTITLRNNPQVSDWEGNNSNDPATFRIFDSAFDGMFD